jgi:uncharacterized protein YjbI with pentapeptide repeats
MNTKSTSKTFAKDLSTIANTSSILPSKLSGLMKNVQFMNLMKILGLNCDLQSVTKFITGKISLEECAGIRGEYWIVVLLTKICPDLLEQNGLFEKSHNLSAEMINILSENFLYDNSKNKPEDELKELQAAIGLTDNLTTWGLNLQKANLADLDLYEAYLPCTDFHGANLTNTKFKKAKLHQANFGNANVSGTDFKGAQMHGVSLVDAYADTTTNFTNAILSNTNFTCAKLPNANFADTYLNSATLTRANLMGATSDITKTQEIIAQHNSAGRYTLLIATQKYSTSNFNFPKELIYLMGVYLYYIELRNSSQPPHYTGEVVYVPKEVRLARICE